MARLMCLLALINTGRFIIVRDEIIRGSGGLVAVIIKLGWLISGPATGSKLDDNNSHAHLAVITEGSSEVDKLSDSSGLE